MSYNEELKIAVKNIYDFVRKAEIVQKYVDDFDEISSLRNEENSEEYYKEMAKFVKSRREIGELCIGDYVFKASFYTMGLNDERWTNGKYDDQLNQISHKIEELKKEYGLSKDEFWKIDEGPKEWKELNEEYNQILDNKLISVFHELNFSDICDLYLNNKLKYEKLYEKGRSNTFNSPSEIEKLSDIAEKYKQESTVALKNKAFFSSAIMSGAAIEAILLREVMIKSDEIMETIESISKNNKPKSSDPRRWTLYELIIVAENAGWLPHIKVEDDTLLVNALVDVVRLLRNFLHPGKILRERSTNNIQEGEAEFANSILVVLYHIIKYINSDSKEA